LEIFIVLISGVRCLRSQFIDKQQHFVFELIGEGNVSHLKTSYPAGFFIIKDGVKHFPELIYFVGGVLRRITTCIFIEFLIVEVFRFLFDAAMRLSLSHTSWAPQHPP